ncbi:probable cyclin-dependent serine/threonine-protein kinase DDB_G0292550 isoform X2 [Anastrepha obliqua]|nr:probable cyclin-dependent serine/threonine-protein kinase DDB_G0292550 isoform X2 [Anastrepha obliqua]
MDSVIKIEDSNCNIPTSSTFNNSSAISTIFQMCQSSCTDYVGVLPPPPHDMSSVNSVELNAQTSLSDDSGVPLTTNSSISSGDSYRQGLCKHEIEIVESDGEVSQFDSLDNCSEGGMSAENFNTLKKVPLAPIDPPLEFQDSPDIAIGRCIKQKLRRLSSSHSSLEQSKDSERNENSIRGERTFCKDTDLEVFTQYFDKKKDLYLTKKPIYSSDSILSNHTENVYDEPNNVIGNYAFKSTQISEPHTYTISPSLPLTSLASMRVKRDLCPYYQDHTKYFKAIPSEQDSVMSAAQKFNTFGLSEIHDYDLYYGIKRNAFHCESGIQKKVLYSPRNVNNYCHSHHIYTGPSGCANRPNSRNSLNSRLSSSHNSLSTSSANKPDDSIFITQAMSHDALLTREISDFYNVPIDSDIYALPIDMVKTDKNNRVEYKEDRCKDYKKLNNLILTEEDYCKHSKLSRKNNRNKRKKRNGDNCESDVKCDNYQFGSTAFKSMNKKPDILSATVNYDTHGDGHTLFNLSVPQERLHMTLNEVKKYYQTLYSSTNNRSDTNNESVKNDSIKRSNETIWSESSPRLRNKLCSIGENVAADCKLSARNLNNENNDKLNNNNINNIVLANNYSITQNRIIKVDEADLSSQVIRNEKKTQFSLNLKQKFCNIFRIRRTQPQCQTSSSGTEIIAGNRDRRNTVDKHKKFQSRALPPLPNKTDSKMAQCKGNSKRKQEARSLQFTSSIEKVKDYGWYWGPLSSEAAEKVLSTEPDGSFIVRDSSDDHYIFSLSFKLNNCVRHVRIEQDQGTFSFGSYAKFKSQTITEFIEKAVEHSRSGRYLFFLHRRPEHGPMRVQLTNPVSRFKHVQSLQHMCRFVILKTVIRKDLIQSLPLPRRLLDYLNYRHCFSEQIEIDNSHHQ